MSEPPNTIAVNFNLMRVAEQLYLQPCHCPDTNRVVYAVCSWKNGQFFPLAIMADEYSLDNLQPIQVS